MNKKILICSIIAVAILIIVSFSSVVGFQPKKSISTVCSTISNIPPAENIYLEDVKILLSGRCRSIGWDGFRISEQIWTMLVIIVAAIITILILTTRKDYAYSAGHPIILELVYKGL